MCRIRKAKSDFRRRRLQAVKQVNKSKNGQLTIPTCYINSRMETGNLKMQYYAGSIQRTKCITALAK